MFKTILIPVDVTTPEDTQKLLAKAKEITAGWGTDLHVLTVVPTVGMAIVGSYFDDDAEAKSRVAAAQQLKDAIAAADLSATPHIAFGTVYDCVIKQAAKLGCDLILIGAHQPELQDYLLGTNAARVVRHAKQSVLVLRD